MTGVLVGSAVLAVATVARVYRGGTTLNDHLVAIGVVGCLSVYPLLWWGASLAGAANPVLAVALGTGALLVYLLFHVLDARTDPGLLRWPSRLTQVAYAFSIWCGPLFVVWVPFAAATRRPMLWPGAWLLVPLALAGWGTAWTYVRRVSVRSHTLWNRPDVPPPPEVRIVHLSDPHASPLMHRRELDEIMATVNSLDPDLVVISGDLVMPFSERTHDYLLDALRRLRAPVFACPGNHDVPVCDVLRNELAGIGAAMLVDEVRRVEVRGVPIEIAGVGFHWRDARRRCAEAIARMEPVPGAAYRILLAHDPRLLDAVPDGRFDLVLSGHTHGGQLGTDMFGVPWSVLRWFGVRDQGFFFKGGTVQYVHRGNWHTGLPPRLGVAPEIVLHRIGAA